MSSYQEFLEGEMLKKQKIYSLTAITAIPGIQVQHCGDELYAKATVNADGDIILKADDTDGETTTVLTCDVSEAGYNSFGECEAAINATGSFRSFLIGVKPSDTSTNMLAALAATSCRTDNGLTLFVDPTTSGVLPGFAFTNNKFTGRPSGDFSTQKTLWNTDELIENMLNYLSMTITCTDGGTINIWSIDDVNDVETLLYSVAFVSATKKELGETVPADVFIKAALGHRLLIQLDATTAADDFSVPIVLAHGTCKHLLGREVSNNNYTGMI